MHPTSAPTVKKQEFAMPTRLQVDATSRSNNIHGDYAIIAIIFVVGFFLVAVVIGCLVHSKQRNATGSIEPSSHHQKESAPVPLEVTLHDNDEGLDLTRAVLPGCCGLENVHANTCEISEVEICAQYWTASKPTYICDKSTTKHTVLVLEALAGMSYHGSK
jgi:hypothetical protein